MRFVYFFLTFVLNYLSWMDMISIYSVFHAPGRAEEKVLKMKCRASIVHFFNALPYRNLPLIGSV